MNKIYHISVRNFKKLSPLKSLRLLHFQFFPMTFSGRRKLDFGLNFQLFLNFCFIELVKLLGNALKVGEITDAEMCQGLLPRRALYCIIN